MTTFVIKRAYEPSSPTDGYRVLVDRLWPQGLSHADFHYDMWAKQIAPSAELREWFHQDRAGRWEEFRQKYLAELRASPQFQALKRQLERYPRVTLLYGSRDTLHNNAVIVQQALQE